jgi:hypothetical protein
MMQPTLMLAAFASLGTATPISLSEMLGMMDTMEHVPSNSTANTNNNTTAAQDENQSVARRDESKTSHELCDTIADLFNQGAEVNGTKTDTREARENQIKGYSWDGPVYDGEKGFIPNAEYFDDDPDKPDGPSIVPPGGAEYPH